MFSVNKLKFLAFYHALKAKAHAFGAFVSEEEKIVWAAALLKGDARNWYEARYRRLRKERILHQDTWETFLGDLKERYKDSTVEITAMKDFNDLSYQNDIEDFIDKLRDVLIRVEISPVTAIWKIRQAIPFEIWKEIPGEPQLRNLNRYLIHLRESGLKIEAMEQNLKLSKTLSSRPSKTEDSKPKSSNEQAASKKAGAGPQKNKNPGNKQKEKTITTATPAAPEKTSPNPVGETGPAKGKTFLEAHKGISQEEIDQRKNASPKACTLCGEPPAQGAKWPHSWKYCPGPKRTTGGPYAKKTATATNPKKRKRTKNEESSSDQPDAKQAKATALASRVDPAKDESDSDDGEYYRFPNRSTAATYFR